MSLLHALATTVGIRENRQNYHALAQIWSVEGSLQKGRDFTKVLDCCDMHITFLSENC